MEYAFSDCKELIEVPSIDTSDAVSFFNTFSNCTSLQRINGTINLGSATTTKQMFSYCGISNAPTLSGGSNITEAEKMFSHAENLTSAPAFSTGSMTKMKNMFDSCYSMTTVPTYDYSSATDMERIFYGCRSLVSIGNINSSSVPSLYQ